jgi:hypothetical protein
MELGFGCRRGLAAVRDIKKGELVLRVPKSVLITRDSLLKDEKLCSFVNNNTYSSLSPTQVWFFEFFFYYSFIYLGVFWLIFCL